VGSLYRRKKNGKELPTWWVKYYANGRCIRESTETTKESEARLALKDQEGKAASGQPILPRVNRILYDDAAKDLRQHYKTTGERDEVESEGRLVRAPGHRERPDRSS
jgi:hypothetical protein